METDKFNKNNARLSIFLSNYTIKKRLEKEEIEQKTKTKKRKFQVFLHKLNHIVYW
jgi:hypothetical protein